MFKPKRLPSGAWHIRWYDAYGKRKSATFTTLEQAKKALRDAEVAADDIRSGLVRPGSELTLRAASVDWLKRRAPAPNSAPDVMRRRGRRVADNRRHLELHILPELGHLRPAEVDDDVIQAFIRHLEAKPTSRRGEINAPVDSDGKPLPKRTLRPGMINTVIITLRKFMRDLKHPITISYRVPTSDYGWIKSPSDVGRVLAACDPPWFRMCCEIAAYAGLRWGEVVGLLWNRVDFDRQLIQVDRSYDGPTKSKHVRAVPLAPELAAQLKRWRFATGAASKGLVVTMPRAEDRENQRELADLTDVAKRVRRACKRAGVEPVTYHQLRHTYASHTASQPGMSLPIVGAVLGHADPKTTARYAHVDTASLARDPRLHLTFAAPAGKVVPLAGNEQATALPGTPVLDAKK